MSQGVGRYPVALYLACLGVGAIDEDVAQYQKQMAFSVLEKT